VVSLQAQTEDKAKWQVEKNELQSHVLLLQMQVQGFTTSRGDHQVVSLNPDKMPLYGEEAEEEEEEDREKDEEKEKEDGEMEEVPGEVEEVEGAGSDSEGSFTGDWSQRYDVNWGRQDHSAQDPYTNRGRTAEVSRVLEAYGFSKDEVKPPKQRAGQPHPCFESQVRKAVKSGRVLPNGEMESWPISPLAHQIWAHECWTYSKEGTNSLKAETNDLLLVKA